MIEFASFDFASVGGEKHSWREVLGDLPWGAFPATLLLHVLVCTHHDS
jgi:hypothetical protein